MGPHEIRIVLPYCLGISSVFVGPVMELSHRGVHGQDENVIHEVVLLSNKHCIFWCFRRTSWTKKGLTPMGIDGHDGAPAPRVPLFLIP